MTPIVLDEVGRACPLPVIALGRALRAQAGGSEVLLLADDPVVLTDVPVWCSMVGAQLLSTDSADGTIRMLIRLPVPPADG